MDIVIGADGLALIVVQDGRNWFSWQEWLCDVDCVDVNDEDGA